MFLDINDNSVDLNDQIWSYASLLRNEKTIMSANYSTKGIDHLGLVSGICQEMWAYESSEVISEGLY